MAIRVKVVNEPPFIRVKGLSGGGGSDSVEVILNTKCINDVPVALRLDSTSVYGWSVIRSAEDRTKIDGFCGHYTYDDNRSVERGFNQLLYRDYCKYEITAIYSDDGKTKITDIPLSYFRMHRLSDSNSTAVIGSTSPVTANIMAYKVKISFVGEVLEQDFFVRFESGNPIQWALNANVGTYIALRDNDVASITALKNFGITVSYVNAYGNRYAYIRDSAATDFYILFTNIFNPDGVDVTGTARLTRGTVQIMDNPSVAFKSSIYRYPVYTVKVKFIKNLSSGNEQPAPSEFTAYFTNAGANNRNTDVGRNSNYSLYDANGQKIVGDSRKTYTITGVFTADGVKLETSSSDSIKEFVGNLLWYSNVLPSTGTFYYAYRLTYTES